MDSVLMEELYLQQLWDLFSLRYWNIDIMKIYTHFLAGRGTDYTYDPNKIPKKPEMYAVRKAIAFVKEDPKNRCNKNIRMKIGLWPIPKKMICYIF